jgi:G:T-mismatch repair DNA endonuclease (very short patch repair protein)
MNGKRITVGINEALFKEVNSILNPKNLIVKSPSFIIKNKLEIHCLRNELHPKIYASVHTIRYSNPHCAFCRKLDLYENLIKECGKRNVKIDVTNYDSKGRILAECMQDLTHPKWWCKPGDLKTGGGCPHCSRKTMGPKRITLDEIKTVCAEKNIYIVEETFTNTQKRAQFGCLINKDHPLWWTAPNEVKSKGTGCWECSTDRRRENMTTPLDDIKNVLLDKGIEIVGGEHKNLTSILEYKCLKNKNHPNWSALVFNLYRERGTNCPTCSKKASIGEIEICKFLDEHNIEYKRRQRKLIAPKEIDIYLQKYNIGIEYHGLYWHNENKRNKHYHFQKRVEVEKHNIRLLQFWESEWLQKKEIVQSIILSKLGIYQTRVYARNCEIRPVLSNEAEVFLNRTHLMGKYKTAKHIGLFFNGRLVCMTSYKKYKEGIDISRFSCELNTQVYGGLSKLLKYIEINNNPQFIQYYIDLRYGNGDAISQIGYSLENITLGWWWTDNINVFNRLHCRANMDDRHLTEREHAKELKLYKLYDAGQAKYIKRLNRVLLP